MCIDDTFSEVHARHIKWFPVKGSTYTVRDIIPAQEVGGNHTAAVLLVEIVNPPSSFRPDWGESGFDPSRFRELEETQEEEVNYTLETISL